MSYVPIDYPNASTPAEIEGTWRDVNGVRVKIRPPSEGNADFARYMVLNAEAMRDPGRRAKFMATEIPAILVAALVTDWELTRGGEPVPFDQAEQVFRDNPKFAQDVYFEASGLEADEAKALEADADELGE